MNTRCGYAVLVALLFGSCATTSQRRPDAVAPITGAQAKLIRDVPVVDIHTHTFNARFLPVRNLLLGKRDAHWAAIFARPPFMVAIAEKIARLTSRDGLDPKSATEQAAEANRIATEVHGPTTPVGAAELQTEPTMTGIQKIAEGAEDQEVSTAEVERIARIVSLFATDEPGAGDRSQRKSEIVHFVRCLLASDRTLVGKFQKDHGKQVDLMVSHMMDLAPVFNQHEDGTTLLPIAAQIERFSNQQRQANGQMLYFAAYNPFRDHYAGGSSGRALQLVKNAYETQGAFGVKLYPPAGYTPFWNYIPNAPPRFRLVPHQQWRARYQPGGVTLDPKVLDERLLKLFYWAVDNNVPLFVHTGTNEVEARKGYADMAAPLRWKALLEDPMHKDKLRNLRICFAHAGDGAYWFGGRLKRPGWAEVIYELCTTYKNIYCEFGVHDAVVSQNGRQTFSRHLTELINTSRADPNAYDFSTKILYGSDWYMPVVAARNRLEYLNAHRQAIFEVNPIGVDNDELFKNYFYRNAIAFLNPKERLERPDVPEQLRDRLRDLLYLAQTEKADSRKRGAGATASASPQALRQPTAQIANGGATLRGAETAGQ